MESFIDLNKDQGLWKKVIQEGSGTAPSKNSTVVINYKAAHENERIFEDVDNFKFKINCGDVIKAFEQGVQTMKKGELSVFVVRHDYAYGKEEYTSIPPFSTLIYCIELVEIIN
jgi:FKBP-type peptidyl-prolyl cis-trans isomerase